MPTKHLKMMMVLGAISAVVVVLAVAATSTISNDSRHGKSNHESKGSERTTNPLELAGPWSTNGTYTLDALKMCKVGDALTIVKNTGSSPIQIDSVSAREVGNEYPDKDSVRYEVIKIRQRTSTGELSDNFTFAALGRIQSKGSASGAQLLPVKRSRSWYAIVILISVKSNHSIEWGIQGLNLNFKTKSEHFSRIFKQSVRLPPTSCR